ncbi:SDR family oxidoreductase [Actinomadura roseirufa]|uniref:SDR family oxidoreductase n=1 Tax=Actinomadura roseirufa TaxID=2094049 RepID=UPI001041408A|nr:SDR family oxidoreductase [Actinomadura roseirufa]
MPSTNRTALVTGASRGIGRGIALRLAQDGLLVGVHYGSNEVAAKQTLQDIERAGGRGFLVHAELGVPGDVELLWAGVDAALAEAGHGPEIDVLVNNAGIGSSNDFETITPGEFDRLFAVNVKAPFFIVREGLGRLRDGGRIINISSGVTRIAFPRIMGYSLTKGALETFTHTLALELGPRGITVNSVAPGIVETDNTAPQLATPEGKAGAAAFSVFNRLGQPDDIADIVAFLASDDARWITGHHVDATGGSLLGV